MQVLKERTTRLVLAARHAGKSAAETVAVMIAVFRRLDPRLHASITLDNGTAFAPHGLLASASCSGTGRPGSSPLLSRPERRGGQTTLTVYETIRATSVASAASACATADDPPDHASRSGLGSAARLRLPSVGQVGARWG